VDAALAEARKSLFAAGNRMEWGTPVLYLRASDGKIFDVAPAPIASSAPVTAPLLKEHDTATPAVVEPPTTRTEEGPPSVPALPPLPADEPRILRARAAALTGRSDEALRLYEELAASFALPQSVAGDLEQVRREAALLQQKTAAAVSHMQVAISTDTNAAPQAIQSSSPSPAPAEQLVATVDDAGTAVATKNTALREHDQLFWLVWFGSTLLGVLVAAMVIGAGEGAPPLTIIAAGLLAAIQQVALHLFVPFFQRRGQYWKVTSVLLGLAVILSIGSLIFVTGLFIIGLPVIMWLRRPLSDTQGMDNQSAPEPVRSTVISPTTEPPPQPSAASTPAPAIYVSLSDVLDQQANSRDRARPRSGGCAFFLLFMLVIGAAAAIGLYIYPSQVDEIYREISGNPAQPIQVEQQPQSAPTTVAGQGAATALAQRPSVAVAATSSGQPVETAGAAATQPAGTAQSAQDVLLQRVERWKPYFFDNFSANTGVWYTGPYQSKYLSGNLAIADGVHRWQATALQEGTWSWWIRPDKAPVADFYLSVEISRLEGPMNSAYGVIFRLAEEAGTYRYYRFSIADTQMYAFSLVDKGKLTKLIDWTPNSAIMPGSANRITVIGEGEHFTFYVNDQYIVEVRDNALDRGQVGLIIDQTYGHEAVFQSDNFDVRTP
jgi:hypothetical protein